MSTQKGREEAVRMKLNPISKHVKDRSIILVDDSIVRGTTSQKIVASVRNAGVAEVHMRIGSPIIKAPCYFGVDMSTRGELIGSKHDCNGICKMIGATSLHYVSLKAVVDAIGIPESDLCTGCITGLYSYPVEGESYHQREIEYL